MKYPSKIKLRNSGLTFSFSFLFLFFIIPIFIYSKLNIHIILISLMIIVLSFINPYLLRNPYKTWLFFGELLGKINSTILLIIFFYLVITPAAILLRLFRLKNIFLIKGKESFYNSTNNVKVKSSFKDQF